MKKKYTIKLTPIVFTESKQKIREILWKEIDKTLFEEFGTDVYTWYEIKMAYLSTEKNDSTLDIMCYTIIEITPIEILWQALEEVKERLEIGL